MMTTSTATATSDADDYLDLASERPCHTTELLQQLDAPIRRTIDHVLAHGWPSRRVSPAGLFLDVHSRDDLQHVGRVIDRITKTVWQPIGAWRDPWDLARSIAYNARVRGLSGLCGLAAVEVVLGAYLDQESVWTCVRGGRHLAEQHAKQTIDVEVTHASVKRAQHAGASWTARIYMRPITATAATPKETSYACTVIDDLGALTPELLALLDTFGADGGPVLDLDASPPEHVLLLRDRLPGRRARAITKDDQRITTHLLRIDGYA